MVLLTLAVGVILFTKNINAVKAKAVRVNFFAVYNEEAPIELLQARDHYKNLFELPVLFYLLVMILYVNQDVTIFDLFLSWTFVVMRFFHSYIRATSNWVPKRSKVFIIGFIVLLIHWIYFIIKTIIY